MAISMAVIPHISHAMGQTHTKTPYVCLVIVTRLLDDFWGHPIRCTHKGVLRLIASVMLAHLFRHGCCELA